MADYGGTDNTSGTELTGGGQIASRGTGEIPLPAQAVSVVDSITDVTGALGATLYEIDTSGNRLGPVARPGE
jgi:hypothetical protein